uniref:RING-type domain-containing protein n=1 Tax=Anisakis simplex TaxID=6269 RepID=A0A0M3JGY4_ANISI
LAYSYAVIASNCAACPQLKCERPGCGTLFCYHCQGQWHASQTCDEARKQRGTTFFRPPIPQISSSTLENNLKQMIEGGDIKACPRCRTYIVKMNDGSCNHMVSSTAFLFISAFHILFSAINVYFIYKSHAPGKMLD